MADGFTTIMVSREVKQSLDSLKIHPNQSYSEVIQKLLIEVKV